ncbi:hypothetical protein [Bartonella tribocorum]|uniref:Uncharacterized protein n=1 Tax=Bartonella tribocorum TaxID=85701 RepID=A0A2M6US94_9HYPH|nr:hypothetical protein [Bartonella tribocorum]PIT69065.1 hypothetical protein CER18_04440 [Bartonella tribocorum]
MIAAKIYGTGERVIGANFTLYIWLFCTILDQEKTIGVVRGVLSPFHLWKHARLLADFARLQCFYSF